MLWSGEFRVTLQCWVLGGLAGEVRSPVVVVVLVLVLVLVAAVRLDTSGYPKPPASQVRT